MRIDGSNSTYGWLGRIGVQPASVLDLTVTPTRTVWTLRAGKVDLKITFLSPIEVRIQGFGPEQKLRFFARRATTFGNLSHSHTWRSNAHPTTATRIKCRCILISLGVRRGHTFSIVVVLTNRQSGLEVTARRPVRLSYISRKNLLKRISQMGNDRRFR